MDIVVYGLVSWFLDEDATHEYPGAAKHHEASNPTAADRGGPGKGPSNLPFGPRSVFPEESGAERIGEAAPVA